MIEHSSHLSSFTIFIFLRLERLPILEPTRVARHTSLTEVHASDDPQKQKQKKAACKLLPISGLFLGAFAGQGSFLGWNQRGTLRPF